MKRKRTSKKEEKNRTPLCTKKLNIYLQIKTWRINLNSLQADPELQNESKLSAEYELSKLEKEFNSRLEINHDFSRKLVSFQQNKVEPICRWFKYREGFSKQLIDYFLTFLGAKMGQVLLDPFAGTGTSVFTAAEKGLNSYAIELLPVGTYFMQTRKFLEATPKTSLISLLNSALANKPWKQFNKEKWFPHLAITQKAFPNQTELMIGAYKNWLKSIENPEVSNFFDFILFSVLEEISFTRKDGQYLRWDYRSERTKGKFDKGKILSFDDAVETKITNIIEDLEKQVHSPSLSQHQKGKVSILEGSIFKEIESIPNQSVDFVITSPPYCNRYDYTRTYALELAYLGVNEEYIRKLRQSLLTCTVENKPKNFIENKHLRLAKKAINDSKPLDYIINFLKEEKNKQRLNNNGIINMVYGYFYDTAYHLSQVSDKMKSGSSYIMVNDNVRYNGLNIPVDCLLSSLAEKLNFRCEKIWVLPQKKGNSSQQMAKHGRAELRKSIYFWKKL